MIFQYSVENNEGLNLNLILFYQTILVNELIRKESLQMVEVSSNEGTDVFLQSKVVEYTIRIIFLIFCLTLFETPYPDK